MMVTVSPSDLSALRAVLLNTNGTAALHDRYRALFTLKSLKNDEAVKIISEGRSVSQHQLSYLPYYFISVISWSSAPLC